MVIRILCRFIEILAEEFAHELAHRLADALLNWLPVFWQILAAAGGG